MIVLENNYKKVQCENCGSVLGLQDDDIKEIEYGCLVYTCPCCGHENDYGEIQLAPDNVKFPISFYHFDSGNVSQEDIRKILKNGIENIRENHDNFGLYYVS